MPILLLICLLTFSSFSPLAAAPLVLTAEEQAWLDEHKDRLVLGFDRFFPPVEFADHDGTFDGFSADLIAVLEHQLKITFHKRPVEWANLLAGLESGEIFLAPAIVNNPERARFALFTPHYVQIPQVILTKKTFPRHLQLENMDGLRVAVVHGYASATLVRQRVPQSTTVVEVDNIRAGLHAVSFGVVDAFVENLAVAAYFQEQEGIANLRVAGDIGVPQELSIGISKHYPLLASIMSKALAAIPEADRTDLLKHWIHLSAPVFSQQTVQALKLAAFFTLTALLVLTILAWFLRRRLNEKIRALKHVQNDLREQLDRLILTLEVAKAGFWEFFPADGREEHSPEWYTMLGYTPQTGSWGVDDWARLVHPDDRDQARFNFLDYVRNGGRGDYEAKYRMKAEDGSWRWILAKGRTVAWDEQGNPVRILGLNLDIHEIKTTQEKAQKAQAFIKALLEQSTQFIGLIDHNGVLRMANHTALDWAGASESDVIGKPFYSCPWWPDPDASKILLNDIFRYVLNGGTVRREVRHCTPDGKDVPFDFTASPFRDETGEVVSIIVEARDISQQKESERILAESEQRFRTIFAHAPYSIIINRLSDGRFMDANNAFLSRTGLTLERLQFFTIDEIGRFPEEHRQLIHSELQLGRTVHNLATLVERPDGTNGHLLYSGALVTLGGEPCILSMTTDITELKNAQEALRKSQELFERLFQLSPDMIALARHDDGTLLELNEAFCRSTGYARHEAIGRTSVELGLFVIPQRRQEFADTLARDGKVDNFEFDFRHRDGQIIKCSASSRLITVDDTVCILSITRDVTQLHAMQDMMVQSEKMLSLGGIAAGIAHEINNPLGVVLQAAQTMALRIKPDFPKNLDAAAALGVQFEDVHAYLQARKIPVFIHDIEQAAIRAAGIVRHMLDFSRKSESRRCACHLPTIIDNALTLVSNDYDLKKRYDFRQIDIVREFPDYCPLLYCTETEIEQVILNILRNAAQSMADMTPPPAHPRIRVAIIPQADSVRMEIEDNGPGIPEAIRSRIFDPFFTTKAPGSGTGLGLSVSYFIITKGHHGHLTVRPGEGCGTVFCIDLPLDDASPERQSG